MFVERPSDAICELASEVGVWLMAGVEGNGAALEAELSRLARYAAVFMAVLPTGTPVARSMRHAAPNLLLAERPATDGKMAGSLASPPHADCVVLDATDPETFAVAARGTRIPIIAQRRPADPQNVVGARRASDALQRDLASLGDYAGYIA